MRKIYFILFAVLLCSCSGRTVYLADYIEEGHTDAMPAIRKAIDECRARHAEKLILPSWELRISPEQAYEQYQWISNNDESLKRIAFELDGMKDFSIVGDNTDLLFSGFISPFSIVGCKNITISGINIDFARTFHSEGIVEAVGNDCVDVRFPEDYNLQFMSGCLYFRDAAGTRYPYSNLLEFDSQKREPAYYAHDYWLFNSTVRAEQIKNRTVRIFYPGLTAQVGNIMVFGAAARYNPAFFLSESENILISDVNLYHCGGMGVIAQKSGNIELNHLIVKPAPNKNRVISITADATHFVNCHGYIRMLNCEFCNQKDDATNIHGLYMAVNKILNDKSLRLGWRNTGQYGVDFLKAGMKVEIVDNRTMETYCHAEVKEVRKLNKVETIVVFKDKLPEGIERDMVVAQDDAYPEVLIKNCSFHSNRARGLLLGSRGKMIIEDNYFHIPGAALLFEGDGNYWFEQSGVRDVIVRNNVFENCNYGSPSWGAACIAVGSGIPEPTGTAYHRNILIENNLFKVFDPRILSLYSIDGLTYRNNTIEMTDAYVYGRSTTEHFVQNNCSNVSIE